MPNIILSLTIEIRRVEALMPGLENEQAMKAQRALNKARRSLESNILELMMEATDDLNEIWPEIKK